MIRICIKVWFITKKIYKKLIIYYLKLKFKPLLIRKKTTDYRVFEKIFFNKDLSLPIHIKPKLIIDCGAYVGYSTIWFANKYPKAKIIAVEPEISNFRTLKVNTQNLLNVQLIRSAVWKNNANLKIKDSGGGKWAFVVEEVNPKEKDSFKAVSINGIIKKSDYNIIDILKLDIEGAEKEVFSHNTEWLNQVNILIIELHECYKKGCNKPFISAIKNYDFKIYRNGENIILIRKNILKVR